VKRLPRGNDSDGIVNSPTVAIVELRRPV